MRSRTIAASALVLGLALATLTAVPAQADALWNAMKFGLQNTIGYNVPAGSTIVAGAGDGTIVITGHKQLNFLGTGTEFSSIDATAFAGAMFSISNQSSLTITNVGDRSTFTVASGYSVFTGVGDGQVVLFGGRFTMGPTIFSGPNSTINTGTNLTISDALGSGTGLITNNGAIVASGNLNVPAGLTLTGTGTTYAPSLTIDGAMTSGGQLTVVGATTISATGALTNNDTVNASDFTVDAGGTVTNNSILSAFGVFSNAGTITSPSGSTLITNVTATNSGTLRLGGTLRAKLNGTGTIDNTGTIIPSAGSSILGTITGNNYVVSFSTHPVDETAIPARTVLGPTFAAAEQTLPVPDGPYDFVYWYASGKVDGSTSLASIAPGGTVTLIQAGTIPGFGTPIPGVPFTGYFGEPGYLYQWYDNNTLIPSETADTITPTVAMLGHVLKLDVTVVFPSGYSPATVDRPVTFQAVRGEFVLTPPTVRGLTAVGSTLVADASLSFSPAPTSVSYAWFRGATPVGTGATYLQTAADVGSSLKVVVTPTLANYATRTVQLTVGPVTTQPVLTVTPTNPTAGDTITVSAPGLAPNTTYTVELHSNPVVLGTLTTSATGLLGGQVTIPAGTAGGAHTIVLLDPNGNAVTSAPLTVTALATLASTGAAAINGGIALVVGLLALGALLIAYRRRRLA